MNMAATTPCWSYSPAALQAFRRWCAAKYRSIETLNEAWGNVFWSMEYRSFDEIELPNLTVTEAHPSHLMDFSVSRPIGSSPSIDANADRPASCAGRDDPPNFMGAFVDF